MNASGKKLFIALIVSLFSMNALAQADLIGTVAPRDNGAMLELGFSSDKSVRGMQFDIVASEGVSFGKVGLDGCLAALPAAFSGSTCTLIDDRTIRVVVLSLSGAELPNGFIGRIFLPATAALGSGAKVGLSRRQASGGGGSFGALKFSNIVIGGKNAESIEADFAEIVVGN